MLDKSIRRKLMTLTALGALLSGACSSSTTAVKTPAAPPSSPVAVVSPAITSSPQATSPTPAESATPDANETPVSVASADPAKVKTEMATLLDNLATGGAVGEATIDWDSLVVTSPQLKGMDLHAEYVKMASKQQEEFRKGFVNGFSKSFQGAAQGKKFSDAAKVPGAMTFNLKGDAPNIEIPNPGGKIVVGYTRKKGALKINKLLIGG